MRAILAGQGLPDRREMKGCVVRYAYRVRETDDRATVLETRAALVEHLATHYGAKVEDREATLSDEGELAGRIEEAADNLRTTHGEARENWRGALECYRSEAAAFIEKRGGADAEPFVVLRGALKYAEGAPSISL